MKYQRGFKYQLVANESIFVEWLVDYEIDLPFIKLKEGILTGIAGYAWDGPSGPTIDTKSFMRPSLFHDIGYQLMRLELLPRELREKFDDLLVELCLEDGMLWIRTKWVHLGVDRFAASAAHPDHIRRVLTAP